jgi:putative resolvase
MHTLTITKAAELLGCHVKTLQRLDRQGVLVPEGRTATNRRYYTTEQLRAFRRQKTAPGVVRRHVAYCRVSSQAQKPDLENQRKALEQFCLARGLSDTEFISEVGGGMNFSRPKFLELLDSVMSGDVATLLVAHKDRLARFGFPLIEHVCTLFDCEILVLNHETLSPEQEMVQDLMTIVHCFSSRLYGLRNYRKALKAALEK